MALTSTPHRRRKPGRILGIPTIPDGRFDGGTPDVSTVDAELLTRSTPRGLARSWWPGRTPSPGPTPRQRQPQIRVNPRMREADEGRFDNVSESLPLPPRARG